MSVAHFCDISVDGKRDDMKNTLLKLKRIGELFFFRPHKCFYELLSYALGFLLRPQPWSLKLKSKQRGKFNL
jgi:hypothetical protein